MCSQFIATTSSAKYTILTIHAKEEAFRAQYFLKVDALRWALQYVGRVIRNKTSNRLMVLADSRYTTLESYSIGLVHVYTHHGKLLMRLMIRLLTLKLFLRKAQNLYHLSIVLNLLEKDMK